MSGTSTADREIVLTRVFDAPRSLVFRAWTQPEHLMQWLAPKGFVVILADVDLRSGGAWRSGMRSPDGVDYYMRGTYREIVEPERLVFTHSWEDDTEPGHLPGHEALISVTFAESGGKTTMTFQVTGLTSDASRDGQREGWSQAFDNLAAHLRERQANE